MDAAGPTALDVAGPTSKRKIIAWGMWDWGSQPFNTVITTFVFSVYITSSSFGATNATSTALAISTAIAAQAALPTPSRESSRGCPHRCTS